MEASEHYSASCTACLTSNRTTLPVENVDIFVQLTGIDVASMSLKEILVCWECMALIKKVLRFQEKVKKAQLLLNLQQPQTASSSLSSLVKSDTYIIDVAPCELESSDSNETDIDLHDHKQQPQRASSFLSNLVNSDPYIIDVAPCDPESFDGKETDIDLHVSVRKEQHFHDDDSSHHSEHEQQPQRASSILSNLVNSDTYIIDVAPSHHSEHKQQPQRASSILSNLVNSDTYIIDVAPCDPGSSDRTETDIDLHVSVKKEQDFHDDDYDDDSSHHSEHEQQPQRASSFLSNLVNSKPYIIDVAPCDPKSSHRKKTDIDLHVSIKKEPDFHDSHYDDDSSHHYKHEEMLLEGDIKTEKNVKKTRRIRFATKADTRKNLEIDWEDPISHFSKSILSDKELSLIGTCYNKVKRKKKQKCCHSCKKMFLSRLDANRHETYAHILDNQSEGPFQCLQCKEECRDANSLRAHWTTHNRATRCNYCQEAVPNFTSILKIHLLKHRLFYTCKECGDFDKRTYFSYQDFSHHYKTLHEYYYCDYCQKKKKSKNSIIKHIRSLHVRPVCGVCGKTFLRHHSLQCHIDAAHPESRQQEQPELRYCVECDKQFGSALLYKKHLASTKAHNPAFKDKKVVPCPQCSRVFTRTHYMRSHQKQVHTKTSEHRCVLCNKILFSAWSLKQHIAGVHMKIRAPKDKICDVCGYGFSTNSQLTKHRRVHTGERPYYCSHCPAAFTQCSPLKSHLRTQHNVF